MFSRILSVNYRISLNPNFTVQKITCHRSLHLACTNLKRDPIFHRLQCHQLRTSQRCSQLNVIFSRHISENATKNTVLNTSREISVESADLSEVEELTSKIPEPPTPITPEIVEVLVGEPSLQSLGIGSWYPHGIIQQWLDFLHVTAGFPWWGSIVFTTVCIRILIFPLVIRLQRYAAKSQNLQPEIQYYQEQVSEARKMGDRLEALKATHELHDFMKKNGIDPLKNAFVPLIQAPIFLSMFWGLRGMVKVPIESMKYGGLWWFLDLTNPDPYYILPLITSATLSLTIEMGTDTMRLETLGILKYVLRLSPIVMFPFIMNFEGAVLCYWVSTNLFSVLQVAILRIPTVRTYFGIEKLIKHDKKKLPMSRKNFVQSAQDTWTNLKVAREVSSREVYDETVFMKAGRGPVPKTYKYDPTKVVANAVLSKRRD